MNGDCTLFTAPTAEPVFLSQLRRHCRVEHNEDNEYLELCIRRAREVIERQTGLALLQQTWDQALEAFPCGAIVLKRPPLVSVTSVTYIDTAGATQVLDPSAYTVNTRRFPGELVPVYGTNWPATRSVPNAVIVRFVAGYGTSPEQVPGNLLQAILLTAGDFYAHREETITGTIVTPLKAVQRLLANVQPYVV